MDKIKKNILLFAMFFSFASVGGILFSKNVFETFVPRSIIFKDTTLTLIYSLSSIIFFANFLITGLFNYQFYLRVKRKKMPFKGYFWSYAMRSLTMCPVFLMELVSVFIAAYWAELIIRLIACWFGIGLIVVLFFSFKYIDEIPSVELYEKMSLEIDSLKKTVADLERIIESQKLI